MQEQLSHQYVGIDLHRRRSVIVRMDRAGEVLEHASRVDNDPLEFALADGRGGRRPRGRPGSHLWLVLGRRPAPRQRGQRPPRAPARAALGLQAGEKRRARTPPSWPTGSGASDLPEAWIAPPEVRELRELVRYRAKLVALRTSAKAQVHAVMAKQGILPELDDMFGPGGQRPAGQHALRQPYALRVESLRRLLEVFDDEVDIVESQVHKRLRDDTRATGPSRPSTAWARSWRRSSWPRSATSAASPSPATCAAGPGSPPATDESDNKVHRGHITKQGTKLVRWAAIEAVARYHGGAPIAPSLHAHRRPPGQQDRPGGGGPQTPHPGLLRPARRRDPLPGQGRRLSKARAQPGRELEIDVAPQLGRGR